MAEPSVSGTDALTKQTDDVRRWSLRTSSPLQPALCTAILLDNAADIVKCLREAGGSSLMRKRVPAEVRSPAGHVIKSKDCTVLHLITIFCSANTIRHLKRESYLQASHFQQRLDLETELHYLGTVTKRSLRNVPAMHLCAIRDSDETLSCLIREGFVRSSQEVNGHGENILHASVEEEAVKIVRLLLQDRDVISFDILMDMLSRKNVKLLETPLMKAANSHETVMLINMIRLAPRDLLSGLENIAGLEDQSIYSFLFSNIRDSRILVELIKELLRKKVPPDTGNPEKAMGLRSAVTCESLALEELSLIVDLFCKCGAKVNPNVVIALLNSPARSGDEVISVMKVLLNNSDAVSTLSGNRQADAAAARTAKSNAILRALNCPRLNLDTVTELVDMFERYTELAKIFPTPEEVAPSILDSNLLLAMETDLYKAFDEPLNFILSYVNKIYSESQVKVYKSNLLFSIMETLCGKTNFPDFVSKALAEDISDRFKLCFKILTNRQFDFNEVNERRSKLPMFQLLHKNVPNEVVMNCMVGLPASFDINIQNYIGENIATKCIIKLGRNFELLMKVLKILQSKGFDFSRAILENDLTILIYFIQQCSKFMHSIDCSPSAKRHPNVKKFFTIFHFIVNNNCDMLEKCESEDGVITALSEAISQGNDNIVEEILIHNPKCLYDISPQVMLSFIRSSPHIVHFMSDDKDATLHEHNVMMQRENELFVQEESVDHPPLISSKDDIKFENSKEVIVLLQEENSLKQIWRHYVRIHHDEIMEMLYDDPSFEKEVEVIYDHFVDNNYDEQKKRVLDCQMESIIFQHPDNQGAENLNSDLMKKVVDHETLRQHPLVTEYLEKFYMNAFAIATFFALLHMVFLILLCGYLIHVVTDRGEYHSYEMMKTGTITGKWECDVNTCLHKEQINSVKYNAPYDFCLPILDRPGNLTGCKICNSDVKNRSICLQPFSNQTIFTRCPMRLESLNLWISPGQYILLTFCVVTLFKEVLQLILDIRGYLKDILQNLVELTLMGSTILLTVNVTECTWKSGFKEIWQYEVGVVSVLSGWFVMFAYLTRFPAIGTYVIMFYRTVATLFWVLLSFSTVFFGYVFAFQLLMSNKYPFRTVWSSFFKTFAMMLGELDYATIFSSPFNEDNGDMSVENWKLTHHENLLRIVFLSFNLLISIVLMNLLVGLTVGDVDQINREAETQKWKRNIAFADYAEETVAQIRSYYSIIQRIFCCKKDVDMEIRPSHKNNADNRKKSGVILRNLQKFTFLKLSTVSKLLGFVDQSELHENLFALEKRKLKIKPVYRVRSELDSYDEDDANEIDIIPAIENLPKMGASHYLPSAFNTRSEDLFGGAYGRIGNLHGTGIEDTTELQRMAVPEICLKQMADGPLRSRDPLIIFPSRHERKPQIQESSEIVT